MTTEGAQQQPRFGLPMSVRGELRLHHPPRREQRPEAVADAHGAAGEQERARAHGWARAFCGGTPCAHAALPCLRASPAPTAEAGFRERTLTHAP